MTATGEVPSIGPDVIAEVEAELRRAHAKHGDASILNPAMPDVVRLPVLVEEVGEVAKAMIEQDDATRLRAELIQVAAIALTWIEALRDSGPEGRMRYHPEPGGAGQV
jgi:hypothetical protein